MKFEILAKDILRMVFKLVITFTEMLPKIPELENMNTMELYTFLFIALNGPRKMSDMANILKTAKSNITALVDSLEKEGYLKRVPSSDDRRVTILHLTESGKMLYEKLLKNFQILVNEVTSKIPENDLETISQGFFRMVSIFDKDLN